MDDIPALPPFTDPTPTPPTHTLPLWPRAFTHRWLLVYLVLSILPFPLDILPNGEHLCEPYFALKQRIVMFLAKAAAGVEISALPNGSGDTTFNYAELAVHLAASLIAALAWSLAVRGARVHPRVHDLAMTLVRASLAASMFQYGWSKVFPEQFVALGPDRFVSTIGETSPMGILWTFMGASRGYQVVGGVGEALAGAFLLFRRTTLLGALIAMGIMANVVALNFCYDVPVKLFSSHLLLMSLILISPHARRLAAFLLFNAPAPPIQLRPSSSLPARAWIRVTHGVLKAVAVFFIAVWPAWQTWTGIHEEPYASTPPWHGVYTVERFDTDQPNDATRWLRVGINGMGIIGVQLADGTSFRRWCAVDEEQHTITTNLRNSRPPSTLLFTPTPTPIPTPPTTSPTPIPPVNRIELSGTFEGRNIRVTLRRDDSYTPLLTTRGFHWINEFPMNR